jgi:hypothetical protein
MIDATKVCQRARENAECGHLSPAETIELVEVLEKEIAMRKQNLEIKLNLRQQIADLELRHRQRDRDDFIRGITHPASIYR